MHLSAKTVINGRFHIIDPAHDLIGQGAMGVVYRGFDRQTEQVVAIKHLKPEYLTGNPQIVERFSREGEALRQLNHPNIVKVLSTITENDQHYIVMEYVSGGSLRDLLDQHRNLTIHQAVSLALDIADALTRTHRLNIIHRDLKPGNVLIAEDGTPRLTDFGLAQWSDKRPDKEQLTQSGMLMGTMDYLSPEACNGEVTDFRSDIWAFGVLLFEMLVGQLPFQGATLMGLITTILTQPTPDLMQFRGDVNDALADLIYRMLDKDPQRRIPSVRLVGAELEAILYGSSIRSTTATVTSFSQVEVTAPRFETATSEKTAVLHHNLPPQTNALVGRETEMAELSDLVADPHTRLITLIGTGGIGKTRLALEVAGQYLGEFANGVYYVSLANVHTSAELVTAIADAVNFTFYAGGNNESQMIDYLREKQILLLLDNLEEVTAVSAILSQILNSASMVTLLITARERLKLSDEQTYILSSFNWPDTIAPEDALNTPAAILFVQSANRVMPGFEATLEDIEHLRRICLLVGGTPLGIILAAGWVEMLTVAEIATEISQSLDFLETDLRDVPERQRSLRAVFDYTWNLLTEPEKNVFEQLAIFQGGFTRQAAQTVSQASLRDLMSLANRALLYRDAVGRYEIQGLLQQYAAERLRYSDNYQLVCDQHAVYFASLAESYNAGMKNNRQQLVLNDLEAEHDNIRLAWGWALEQKNTVVLQQIINSLCRFYEWRGRYHEGLAFVKTAVSKFSDSDSLPERQMHAHALIWQGVFYGFLGDSGRVEGCLQKSITLLDGTDSRHQHAFALRQLGRFASLAGDQQKAIRYATESLTLYEALSNNWGIAHALYIMGQAHWHLGEYAAALPLYERSLTIRQAKGDQRGQADVLRSLGMLALYQGRLPDTHRYLQESSELRKVIGDRAGTAVSLADLGSASMLAGDFTAACQYLTESVAIYTDLGYRQALGHWCNLLGLAYFSTGDVENSRLYAEQGLNLAQEVSYQRGIALGYWLLGILAVYKQNYPVAKDYFMQSVALQREIGQRDELAWSLSSQAQIATLTGDLHAARGYLLEAMQIAAELKSFLPLSFALPAVALLRVTEAKSQPEKAAALIEQAIMIYGLATRYPAVGHSYYITNTFGSSIAQAAELLPLETVEAARKQGATGDLFGVVGQIMMELSQS